MAPGAWDSPHLTCVYTHTHTRACTCTHAHTLVFPRHYCCMTTNPNTGRCGTTTIFSCSWLCGPRIWEGNRWAVLAWALLSQGLSCDCSQMTGRVAVTLRAQLGWMSMMAHSLGQQLSWGMQAGTCRGISNTKVWRVRLLTGCWCPTGQVSRNAGRSSRIFSDPALEVTRSLPLPSSLEACTKSPRVVVHNPLGSFPGVIQDCPGREMLRKKQVPPGW